jgi:glycopeptide antibiotics resistance protein
MKKIQTTKNRLIIQIRKSAKIIFAVYMIILIGVIILKFPTGMVRATITGWINGNPVVRTAPKLTPFQTIIEYTKNVHSLNDWFIKNLAANIIMFLPYGFLIPLIKNKISCKNVILTGALLSVFIEIFQYVSALGQCDIDDVILNTLGVALGFVLYKIAYRIVS